jgi:signal peptidase I
MQPSSPETVPVSPAPVTPQSDVPRTPHAKSRDGLKNVVATIAVLIAAPLVALFITSFVFQSYEVFGPSMQTTLHDGDRLIVMKAPRTWSKITHHTYMPMRGQIVVFTKADLLIESGDGSKQLIKRVMALPGEKVSVKDGVLTVYNKAHPDGFQPDKEGAYGSVITHTGINGDWTVGEGQVFVAGDNRDNSLDSRSFGPIDTKDIVGTAAFRFLPIKQSRKF